METKKGMSRNQEDTLLGFEDLKSQVQGVVAENRCMRRLLHRLLTPAALANPALGGDSDLAGVWVGGDRLNP